jgi:hypothetical protein
MAFTLGSSEWAAGRTSYTDGGDCRGISRSAKGRFFLSSEDGNDIDDNLCSWGVHNGIAVDVATAIAAWQRHQLPLDGYWERLHPSLPPRREVAVAIELSLQTRRQLSVPWSIILGDDSRIAQLEITARGMMIAMIKTAIILILVLGVFLPVLLILVPVLGGNGTAHQYAESYQGNRQSHCSPYTARRLEFAI